VVIEASSSADSNQSGLSDGQYHALIESTE